MNRGPSTSRLSKLSSYYKIITCLGQAHYPGWEEDPGGEGGAQLLKLSHDVLMHHIYAATYLENTGFL